MESSKTVCITGVTGYIGSWVAKIFLESEQKYNVRGTVRDLNSEKTKSLCSALGELSENLELVEADLLDAESLEQATENWDYVIHVAAVVEMKNLKDEMKVIGPALNGTENVMNAWVKNKVKRVVVTSSAITIMDIRNPGLVNESNWIEINKNTPLYDKSKVMAEKKAWEISEKNGIELVTLLPGIVTGKVLFTSSFASGDLIMDIMTGKIPRWPQIYMPFVDVQDVAKAHLLALTAPPNSRYALSCKTHKIVDVGLALSSTFKEHGYKPTTTELSSFLAWMLSLFRVKSIKRFYHFWNVFIDVDNTKSIEALGLESYKTMEESVVEQGWSFIEHGMVEDKTNGKFDSNKSSKL